MKATNIHEHIQRKYTTEEGNYLPLASMASGGKLVGIHVSPLMNSSSF